MKSFEIRQKFFDFFIKNGHTKVESSSLIPAEDPTLLFANAGMNQFKDCFLGTEKRSYTRAVTIQKCIRAGGKHNDLDNVGRTKRHLTFFEMMGNFSWGNDYFKKEAIRFAWDFLTQEIKLDPSRLHVSVYKDDQESYDIWNKAIGIPAERIVRLGAKDNFWQMGDTGPCGPCTEIYYDFGAQNKEEENLKVGDEGERFLEIWNNVFMQFDRQKDGTDVPLAKPGVDTGMGLERLCWVIQNVSSVYETDLFAGIIKSIEKLSGKKYESADTETRIAFRVLADHIRSTSLAIADGGTPSNDGRGYVLRKIIRRATLFAQKLGNAMIFPRLTDAMVQEFEHIYPTLTTNKALIIKLLTSEVEKFAQNLEHGQVILNKYLEDSKKTKIITGEQVFRLYDTYGFPLELTNIIAYEKGYTVDTDGFEQEMKKQQEQSGRKIEENTALSIPENIKTTFIGYDELETTSKIIALVSENKLVNHVGAGIECWLIPEKTCFYVECGGQVSDKGTLTIHGVSTDLVGLEKVGTAIVLKVKAAVALAIGDTITQKVNTTFRSAVTKNHTATHLLQAALVKILGPQVKQAGSLVTPHYLRFDFTHHQTISHDEITAIERLVNEKIMENIPVKITHSTYKKAVDSGVKAFFGEKYNPDDVRVVTVSNFSAELCGGVHVHATGEIGCFKITTAVSLSTGVRRITAVTGPEALKLFQQDFDAIKAISQEFKVQHDEVLSTIEKLHNDNKAQQTILKKLRSELITYKIPTIVHHMQDVRGIPFGFAIFDDITSSELRDIATMLVQKKPGFYFLTAQETPATNSFFVICASEYAKTVDLIKFAQFLKEQGFKSGGKHGTLQGGGSTITTDFQKKIISWLQQQ